jgi:hypothetical protein
MTKGMLKEAKKSALQDLAKRVQANVNWVVESSATQKTIEIQARSAQEENPE